MRPGQRGPPSLHGATLENEGVFTHIHVHEGLYGQFCHPITYLAGMRRYEADLLLVKGVGGGKPDTASIILSGHFHRFDTVSK